MHILKKEIHASDNLEKNLTLKDMYDPRLTNGRRLKRVM